MEEPLEQFLREVARETWDVFRKDAFMYVLAAALVAVITVGSLGICAGPLVVGFIGLVPRRRRGEHVDVGDLFDGFSQFGTSFAAVALITIAVCLGSMVFVIPGLLAIVFSSLTFIVIAYERTGAVDAIRRSASIVRANFLNVLILLFLISAAQTVASGTVLGVLLTMPLALISTTVAFERMVGARDRGPNQDPGPAVLVR